ncbi:MAG: class I SAM-dependent methyltransferase [Candidatus Velthaea sp.]
MPARVLEPTCGSGAFLAAAADAFPETRELLGVEIQKARFASDLRRLRRADARIGVRFADAYRVDFAALPWRGDGLLAVVGNPPWVTAAALGRADAGAPQPPRTNPLGLEGLAARTGAANFDVAEFLTLKMLAELGSAPFAAALLLKESVARKVLAAAPALGVGFAWAEIVRIDARRWFGAAVDACALLLRTGPRSPAFVGVRADFGCEAAVIAGAAACAAPPSRAVWRQGIKHDAAAVFELRRDRDGWRNGYGAAVEVEGEYVFPLRKARAVHAGADEPTALIVPQQRLGAPTAPLRERAPKLHAYLHAHRARLAARKSSIYRSAPPFAVFGVGPYSFAPWKVAVAGLYAEPRFRVYGPAGGRPVVFGDTSYFVAFADEQSARSFAAGCESPGVMRALRERIVRGKRPVTKRLLESVPWEISSDAG